jgi:hypothetical protein
MNTLPIVLNFHDPVMLQTSGLQVPQPATIQCLPGLVPATADVVTFAGLNYPSGEPARFLVKSRAHLLGGAAIQRLQLNLELVVLHQP